MNDGHGVLLFVGIAAAWLAIGVAGLVRPRSVALSARLLFPLGSALALALAMAALVALFDAPGSVVLPLGLPDLPFHLRVDALSAYFLLLLGGTGSAISLFAAGYFRHGEGTPPGALCCAYHVFMASMVMVLLADDAFAFLVFWELMALSSFFLVVSNHRQASVRAAAYLYLLMAHVGAVAILLSFAVMQGGSGDYSFAAMRAQELSPRWASIAFALALVGFGAKAGLVPLHAWLPEAHPAAPSPVSALMSGVMLKTAIYGLLRVSLDLLDQPQWWWGTLLLGLGLFSALYGVIFSAVQTDMKRLLAYSSVENIGVIVAASGLGLMFNAFDMAAPAALAVTALLYYALSHALFKSLLFLGTGAVLHSTGQRSLGRLGGLLARMPWVGWTMLLGALAGAGLPPLAGFVAEWLMLQSFFFTTRLPDSLLDMLIPVIAALIALVTALAGYVMVKLFGIIFLGRAREAALDHAHDPSLLERTALVMLATTCLLLGLFPVTVITALAPVTRMLVGTSLVPSAHGTAVLQLAPIAGNPAAYSPLVFAVTVGAACALTCLVVRRAYHARLRRAPPWHCGYPWLTARMQDTAEGFGQPIRQIFEKLLRTTRHLPGPEDAAPGYAVVVDDHLWHWLYLPAMRVTRRIAEQVARLQHGRISIYLLYSFLTLIVLLLTVAQS